MNRTLLLLLALSVGGVANAQTVASGCDASGFNITSLTSPVVQVQPKACGLVLTRSASRSVTALLEKSQICRGDEDPGFSRIDGE